MSITRRSVLSGASLTTIAGLAIGNSASALAQALISAPEATVQPEIALCDDSAAGQLFMRGARAAGAFDLRWHSVNHDLGFMLELERLMRIDQPLCIIGLLNDAAATLVIDMARSAGARMQWLGHHSAAGSVVQHRLLTTGDTELYARQLGYEWRAWEAGSGLGDQRRTGASPSALYETGSHDSPSSWLVSLGYLLGLRGSAPGSLLPSLPIESAQVTGQFVSFSIDTARSPRNG